MKKYLNACFCALAFLYSINVAKSATEPLPPLDLTTAAGIRKLISHVENVETQLGLRKRAFTEIYIRQKTQIGSLGKLFAEDPENKIKDQLQGDVVVDRYLKYLKACRETRAALQKKTGANPAFSPATVKKIVDTTIDMTHLLTPKKHKTTWLFAREVRLTCRGKPAMKPSRKTKPQNNAGIIRLLLGKSLVGFEAHHGAQRNDGIIVVLPYEIHRAGHKALHGNKPAEGAVNRQEFNVERPHECQRFGLKFLRHWLNGKLKAVEPTIAWPDVDFDTGWHQIFESISLGVEESLHQIDWSPPIAPAAAWSDDFEDRPPSLPILDFTPQKVLKPASTAAAAAAAAAAPVTPAAADSDDPAGLPAEGDFSPSQFFAVTPFKLLIPKKNVRAASVLRDITSAVAASPNATVSPLVIKVPKSTVKPAQTAAEAAAASSAAANPPVAVANAAAAAAAAANPPPAVAAAQMQLLKRRNDALLSTEAIAAAPNKRAQKRAKTDKENLSKRRQLNFGDASATAGSSPASFELLVLSDQTG